jgi:non-canonical poly(A) RNA polymerase PAPD5/7
VFLIKYSFVSSFLRECLSNNFPFSFSSFDMDGGPQAADFIKDYVKKFPALRHLCMILKVFLHQRELNEVYTGGIGSYALLTMLITHLQVKLSLFCTLT